MDLSSQTKPPHRGLIAHGKRRLGREMNTVDTDIDDMCVYELKDSHPECPPHRYR